MIEKPPTTPKVEQGPEKIPSEEEVRGLFEKFAGSREFTEIKKVYDEHGLRDWEISVANEDGSTREYFYGRKAKHGEPSSIGNRHTRKWTQIEMTNFDKDGFPEGGGGLVAEIRDGEWVEIP